MSDTLFPTTPNKIYIYRGRLMESETAGRSCVTEIRSQSFPVFVSRSECLVGESIAHGCETFIKLHKSASGLPELILDAPNKDDNKVPSQSSVVNRTSPRKARYLYKLVQGDVVLRKIYGVSCRLLTD